EVLLIFQPGQDGQKEMNFVKKAIPAIEKQVDVDWPLPVVTLVNGNFSISNWDAAGDNDGEFIRMTACCVLTPDILAHELSHVYRPPGPRWSDEGMPAVTPSLVQPPPPPAPPPGWSAPAYPIDSLYNARKTVLNNVPYQPLPQRMAT